MVVMMIVNSDSNSDILYQQIKTTKNTQICIFNVLVFGYTYMCRGHGDYDIIIRNAYWSNDVIV